VNCIFFLITFFLIANRFPMKLWLPIIIGAWILISPWLLGFSDISLAKWSDVLCGLVLVMVGVWQRPMQ